jgi:hypothetical protein
MQQPSSPAWPVNDRFLELRCRWMTLIGEHLQVDILAALKVRRFLNLTI